MTRHNRRAGSSSSREDDLRVGDILSEFRNIEEQEFKSFYSTLTNNLEIQGCFFRVMARAFETSEIRDSDIETLKGITNLLLAFYRYLVSQASKSSIILASTANDLAKSRPIIMQYLPHLTAIHLHALHCNDPSIKRAFQFLDAFFLAVYNTEAADSQLNAQQQQQQLQQQQQQTTHSSSSSRVPSLSQSSIFHESDRLDAESVDKLNRRVGGGGSMLLHEPIFRPITTVNVSTRGPILQLLWRVFNKHLADMSKYAVEQISHRTLKLLDTSSQQRIFIVAPVLTEMLHLAYYCIYSGFQVVGHQILDQIDERASANGWPSVLLVVASIKRLAISSTPSESSASVVTSTPGQLAKHMITNASFRAKKISDDIPKVLMDDQAGNGGRVDLTRMRSIAEENANEDSPTELTSPPSAGVKTPMKMNNNNNNSGETGAGSGSGSGKVHTSNKEKLMAKLPNLKVSMPGKKERSHSEVNDRDLSSAGNDKDREKSKNSGEHQTSTMASAASGPSGAPSSGKMEKKKSGKLHMTSLAPNSNSASGGGSPSPTSLSSGVVFSRNNGADAVSVTSRNTETISIEQVEEMIQMKKLPQETITIHSPESGTTLF